MPRASRFVALFVSLVFSGLLSAQSPAALKRDGERAFATARWSEAQKLLAQYQESKPGDLSVLTKLGIALFHLRRGEEAKRYLEYVATKSPNSKNPELFYYLASTLHGLSEWDKAIAAYKSYLRVSNARHPLRANAMDNIRRCVSGMQIKTNEQVALVENLGNQVNSIGDEFAPLPSLNYEDRIYFATARPGSIGGMRNDGGYEDTQRGHWCSDMFIARLATSGWELQGSLGGLLNTARFEVPLGFNADGQILYFFRGLTLYSGEIFADTASKKDEYLLDSPPFRSPVKAEDGDTNPFFFNDHCIIFSSRRPGGQGGLDLWWTVWADSIWAEPANFGPLVNSPYDEDTPFLARNGSTLYFSSNRTEGMGGLDVYKTEFDPQKQTWLTPTNFGTPVNSPNDDAFFHLSLDGRTAFFASDRMGGLGQRDIYIAYFNEIQTEQQGEQVALAAFSLEPPKRIETEAARNIALPTLPYSSEKDILSPVNQKVVEQAASLARNFPQSTILVTLHSDNTGTQPKFDLYNGIKRAEIVGKALTELGVPASKIMLQSVGTGYPLALSVLEASPNPSAPGLNRRIEVSVTALEPLPIQVTIERPFVSELMKAPGATRWDESVTGLSYRVEAATSRQILTNDAIAMFSDLMIESQPGTGAYQYMVGMFKTYKEAALTLKEVQEQGFRAAAIVAYVNGRRVTKAEAVSLLKKFPDLASFVRG